MKKRNKCIVIIVCISICVVFLGFAAYRLTMPPDAYALIEHKDAYTRVAEICYLDYLSSSSIDDREKYYTYSFGGNELYCHTTKHTLSLSDDDLNSMHEVNNTFYVKKKNLETIRVEENFVSFCTVNGMATYIYSVNNDRPNFVNRSDDNYKRIYVKKIADHWYYANVVQQY